MANEINVSATLSVFKSPPMSIPEARSLAFQAFNFTGSIISEGFLSLSGSTPTVIPLQGMTTPHWFWFYNPSNGNLVKIRNGSGGADFLALAANEFAVGAMITTCVPYAVSSGTTLEYIIIDT